jgi:predicted ATPase
VEAPLVGELLAAARGLKVLITSRAPLHLSGEREFAVPPLPLPDPKQLPQQLEHLTQNDAVRLFIERAQAVKADFAVTDENGPTVADICRRLDGLPLAIELAATRIKLFAPQALLSRLDNRLKFLTGGARDLPERQQTIRHTIDWSYELLGEAEQTLFARLGVFVGGCTLEAAEAVCNGDDNLPIEVVDGSAALMDKSLVRQEEGIDGEPRLLMLETIREYALERLDGSGEAETVQQHHTAYYLALAEAAASQLDDPEPRRWLDRLDQEHDNLRAALRWSLTHDATTAGLRLCTALYSFWEARGHWDEGRMWTEAMLAASGEVAPHLRMEALSTIAEFAWKQGDYATATARMTESLSLSRALDDRRAMGHCLMILGVIALKQASYEYAAALLTESMEMSHSAGEAPAGSLLHLGELALAQEEYAQAQQWLQESLAICREGNDIFYIARLLSLLGEVALGQGDAAGARALVQESVAVSRDVGHPGVMASALAAHASAVAAGPARHPEDIQRAARIWGAAEVLREQVGMFLAGADRTRYERAIEHARVRLRPEVWAAAWAEGRALTLEQAITEALEHAGLGAEPRQTFAAN